jgi:hypothetical protein
MKGLVLIFAATTLASCSGAKTQPDVPQTPAPQVQMTPPSPPEAEILKKESCDSGADMRSLEIHRLPSGCELHYTKFGKSKVVSSAKHGTKHCEESFQKIIKELEDQMFRCEAS